MIFDFATVFTFYHRFLLVFFTFSPLVFYFFAFLSCAHFSASAISNLLSYSVPFALLVHAD